MPTDTIVVLEGDETGQELLVDALRVLDPEVIGFELGLERYDLSLQRRRETKNAIVQAAALAMKRTGLGLKGDDHARVKGRRRLAQCHPATRDRR